VTSGGIGTITNGSSTSSSTLPNSRDNQPTPQLPQRHWRSSYATKLMSASFRSFAQEFGSAKISRMFSYHFQRY
jgi:hypothetical protein